MNSYKKPEDEINFKELLKNPIRLFGWIFPLFLVLILVLGIYFVKHLNEISFNVQTVGITDSTLIKKDIELKRGGVTTPVNLELVKSPTPEFIARGKELFNTNCKSCHGENGLGDGPAGAALVKKPRNFHSTEGWTNGRNIDQMYKTLQEGIVKNGMAAYEYIPSSDRFAIISYIRTFAQFPEITYDQLIPLDAAYNLSAGTTVPNNIHVSLAESKLIEENSLANQKYLSFQAKINSTPENAQVQTIKKYSINLSKIYTSFIRSNGEQNLDKFVNDVLANPINAGFRPAVVELSKDEWKNLYDYLKSTTM
ncbi:MAG: cytochrome c [Ignavibacteriales bacterium]|nr:cytochrome c [Ignavibacteriales bacterium]